MENKWTDILKIQGVRAKGYGIIPKMAMLDRRLTIEAKSIYSYFCSYAGTGGTAFPGRDKICADLCIGKDRYYRHFNLLKDYGYVSVEQIKNNNNRFSHNVYTLIDNPEAVAQATVSPCPENKDTVKTPCPENEDTEKQYTGNKDIKSNRSSIKSNSSLYNQSVSLEKSKKIDRQTDYNINIEDNDFFEEIVQQADINSYFEKQDRDLLKDTIKRLLDLEELKINNKVYNSQNIRYYLKGLVQEDCDIVLAKYATAMKETYIKNKPQYLNVMLFNCILEKSAIAYIPY